MVLLAVIGYLTVQGRNVFEESGQSSVVCVRVELVRGMRDMVVDEHRQRSTARATTCTARMGRSKFRERAERQHARWRLWKGHEP